VVDIVDPASPNIIGGIDTPGYAVDVALAGTRAFVADGDAGLQVIDISAPSSPAIVGSAPGTAHSVAAVDSLALVIDTLSDLDIFRISAAGVPTQFWSTGTPSPAIGRIELHADYAYIANGSHGIQVIDISDFPPDPILGSAELPVPTYAHAVTVAGNVAYLAQHQRFRLLDISNPASPILGGYVESSPPGSFPRDITVTGPYAYAIYNYPDLPDKGAYVSTTIFQVIYTPYFTGPTVLGALETAFGRGTAIDVYGFNVYVAYRRDNQTLPDTSGLAVIDISDRTSPTLVGDLRLDGSAHGLAVIGSHAFVGGGSALRLIDLTDPTSPTLAGNFEMSAGAFDLVVRDTLAYVTGDHALQVISVSDPESPVILGSIGTPGTAAAISVKGNHAYVASRTFGLQAVDISNPQLPRMIGTINTPFEALGVATASNSVCVADRFRFQVLPLQCEIPDAILVAGFEATPVEEGILIQWRVSEAVFASFTVSRAAGSNPSDSQYELLGAGRMVPGDGAWEYLDRQVSPGEIHAYKITGFYRSGGSETFGPALATIPSSRPFALLLSWPNPAREEASLLFDLPQRSDLRLRIYDLSGRCVRRLVGGRARTGRHVTEWDGRNDHGQLVASGVYLVRLASDWGTATARVTLVR
jgi:hypothetical protein